MTSPSETFQCEECEKSFSLKRYLTKHTKRVHAIDKNRKCDSSIACPICNKKFLRFSHLQRHQMHHLDIRDWACLFCTKKFIQRAHLLRHIGRFHPDEKVDLKALKPAAQLELSSGMASASTSTANSSDFDQESSESEKVLGSVFVDHFVCKKCHSLFNDFSDYKKHLHRAHSVFRCQHCRKNFNGRQAFALHMRKVRNEQYACECGATFSTARTFRTHEAHCHGTGTFECVECNLVFSQRIQLDRHWINNHFTAKRCLECEWTAESPSRMAEHMLQQHSEEVCGYCGIKDPSKKHLSSFHWRRLLRPISINKRKTDLEMCKLQQQHSGSAAPCSSGNSDGADVDKTVCSKFPPSTLDKDEDVFVELPEPTLDYKEHHLLPDDIVDGFSDMEDNGGTGCKSDSRAEGKESKENDRFLNVLITVRPGMTFVNLKDHVPPDLLKDFPELDELYILLTSDPTVETVLSLQIPVENCETCEGRQWFGRPIQLGDVK